MLEVTLVVVSVQVLRGFRASEEDSFVAVYNVLGYDHDILFTRNIREPSRKLSHLFNTFHFHKCSLHHDTELDGITFSTKFTIEAAPLDSNKVWLVFQSFLVYLQTLQRTNNRYQE